MNEDFDSHRYTRDPQGATPAAKSVYGALLTGGRARSAVAFLRRHWALIAFAALLILPVIGITLGYVARLVPDRASHATGIATSTDSGGKQAKPAPGKGWRPTPQASPPVEMHSVPPSTLEPQTPPAMAVPARPQTPAPGVPGPGTYAAAPFPPAPSGKSGYTPVVYSARHDKAFGDGCSGQLTLDTNGLAFRCPDDPGSSLQVALGDIEAVDGNGVRLISGKKFHFSIAGMGKSNVEQLFANWLSSVR